MQRGPKSICHALVHCSLNFDVWKNYPLGLLIQNAPRNSFKELLSWLIEKSTKELLILGATAFGGIWYVRNQSTFVGNPRSIVDIVAQFTTMVHDYTSYASKVLAAPIFIPLLMTIGLLQKLIGLK